MFGFFPIAGAPVAYSPIPTVSVLDAISFNGYGLQNDRICVTEANFEDAGAAEMNTYPIPRVDGNGFLSRYWRKKTIVLKGVAKCETKEELETLIDEMKRKLYPTEGTLQYIAANGARNITATLVSASFDRKGYNITFVPFSLQFDTNEAFWYDIINESYSASAVTASYIQTVTNTGTAPAFAKVFYKFNAASGTTSVSFKANGKTITVSGARTAGDVVEFDGETKEVFVNGVVVDYSGTFPQIIQGENLVEFTVNGTFSADVILAWRKNYL